MKKNMLKLGGLLLMIPLIMQLNSCVCTSGDSEALPVTLHPQQMSNWCWAASGQMVMEYLGTNVNQCTQVNDRYSMANCCTLPFPGACNLTGWPEFDRYGFRFTRTSSTALTWDQLKKEISRNSYCGKRPFCFTWHWNGGGGHMMVVIGYDSTDGVRHVEVNDLWLPNVGDNYIVTYDRYVSGPTYTHWDDFYQIIKN